MRRWYQTIRIAGVEATFEDPNRAISQFWNEGKWRNFINPLLPKRRGTFLDIGCNAGLFLKTATDVGFDRVIGVESSGSIMQQAQAFKKSNGYDYTLLQQQVGKDFDLKQLPLVDVTLISNMHYYLGVPTLVDLVDKLRARTNYCIVVGAKARRREGCASYDLESIRGYFKQWTELGLAQGVDPKGDPTPRKHMYGVIFKGDLEETKVEGIYNKWRRACIMAEDGDVKKKELPSVLDDLMTKVIADENVKLEDTLYYDYWKRRRPDFKHKNIVNLFERKRALIKDIKKNGMNTPIYFNREERLLDGLHRLSIAFHLGHEYILCRRV